MALNLCPLSLFNLQAIDTLLCILMFTGHVIFFFSAVLLEFIIFRFLYCAYYRLPYTVYYFLSLGNYIPQDSPPILFMNIFWHLPSSIMNSIISQYFFSFPCLSLACIYYIMEFSLPCLTVASSIS